MLVFERKFCLFPLLMSLFFRKRILKTDINKIERKASKINNRSIDVVIPTIGRKEYLYDTLRDLAIQSHLPKNVIIVEQNPDLDSISELDYLVKESWPFCIKHTFTHQSGACNARNLALKEVESEWIFMADDDIRFGNTFLEEGLKVIEKEGFEQISFACYEANYLESKKEKLTIQWDSFGSGCSIVRAKNVQSIFYNKSFEFGYGEDSDFGAQLRNLGYDILYAPHPEILHIKAPVGGFRTKPVFAWAQNLIQPKPSPTVMLHKVLNLKTKQICGYKTVLVFKYYRKQPIKNPIKYFISFKKQWNSSVFWANQLKNN